MFLLLYICEVVYFLIIDGILKHDALITDSSNITPSNVSLI